MFTLTVPWWDIILRAAIIYAGLFALIRVAGKREVGELSPFDLVFLLLISEMVSPSLTNGDNSLAAAFIGLGTLLALNTLVTFLTSRFLRIERVLEGRPEFLLRNGKVDYRALRKEGLSNNDLMAALRENGCMRPSEAEWAVLETSGRISVKKCAPE